MAMTGGTYKLVKTTYPFGDNVNPVNLYVYYKSTQDVNTNKSTISCGMYVTTPSGYPIGEWNDWNAGSYVGTTANTFNGTIPHFSGTRWIAENKTFTVDHKADGTGTATIQWKWAVNSPWGGYVNPSGSFSINLPKIPRATTPTLSATSVQMGKSITVTMNRASSSFTHKLSYTIGGKTIEIDGEHGTSYTLPVPKTLVQYIPNKLSSAVTITCETYSGDTLVGTKTVSFTATVPSASVPTLSVASVQMGNSVTITTNREVDYYTHKLSCTINGRLLDISTGVGASHKWDVPNVVQVIPNATRGTGTISCTTYNGTKEVGTKTVAIEIIAPGSTVPSISSGTVQMGKTITIATPRASSKYTHNLTYSIGSKSGTIATGAATSAEWEIPLPLISEVTNATSGTLKITCETKNGTAPIGTETITASVKVPAASVPTLSKSSGVMGESITINTNSLVSQYRHTISFSFAGAEGTIDNNAASSVNWNIPLSLAANIPNSVSGSGVITCITRNGTETVGTTTCLITLTVPNNDTTKPEFDYTISPIHSLPEQFAGLFVLGKSEVGVTFTANSEYANITKYSAKVGATVKESTSPTITHSLSTSGSIPVALTVTDSRGYSREVTTAITAIPYERPSLTAYTGENSVVCTRCDNNGNITPKGERVAVKASAYFSEVFYHNKAYNTCRIWYRHKTSSVSDYSMGWVQLGGASVNEVIETTFEVRTSYTFQLKVEDDVGEERVYTYTIPDISTVLHLGRGGKNLGLGQFCDYSGENRIDVGWTTHFNTGIAKRVIFEADSSGWSSGVLSDAFSDADTTMLMEYNLFIAVVVSTGGTVYPILCARHGTTICGSYNTVALRMIYTEAQDTLSFEYITTSHMVTALYALL